MRTPVLSALLSIVLSGCAVSPGLKRGVSEEYVFLFLPCFSEPSEYTVRAERGRFTIRKQQFVGAGGFSYERVGDPHEIEVTEADWTRILTLVAASGFWKPDAPDDPLDFKVLDGDSLKISGRRGREAREVFLRDAYQRTEQVRFITLAAEVWQTYERILGVTPPAAPAGSFSRPAPKQDDSRAPADAES